ncbi:hypothetical protein NDU88_004053 [Pleurodeles waltl]|uniref:Uncharacterized protein n=1 Tax=Pleurodeles waltl TaxID=8319 RepID=A0AAV7UG21_PLEWA|nr:hypothetical protein NDU88_004053 [Pleurodeles waltl]
MSDTNYKIRGLSPARIKRNTTGNRKLRAPPAAGAWVKEDRHWVEIEGRVLVREGRRGLHQEPVLDRWDALAHRFQAAQFSV